jgi:hypothetical protein
MGLVDLVIIIIFAVIITLAIRANKISVPRDTRHKSVKQFSTASQTKLLTTTLQTLELSSNNLLQKFQHLHVLPKPPIPPEPPPDRTKAGSSRINDFSFMIHSTDGATQKPRKCAMQYSLPQPKINGTLLIHKSCNSYLSRKDPSRDQNYNSLSRPPPTNLTKIIAFSVFEFPSNFCLHKIAISLAVFVAEHQQNSKGNSIIVLTLANNLPHYNTSPSQLLSTNMNIFYDVPIGFQPRNSSECAAMGREEITPEMLSPLEASLFLRGQFTISTRRLRVMNCPTTARDNHVLWRYLASPVTQYTLGDLPFGETDTLDENAITWGGHGSTRRRPTLYSIGGAPMRFSACPMTLTGKDFPGTPRADGSFQISSFPFLSEHRMNLKELIIDPVTKKSLRKTRVVQVQPTMILPGEEPFWSNAIYISGLGCYQAARPCITGAILSHLYHFLLAAGLRDQAKRFKIGSQLDWTHLQYDSRDGHPRVQHVATLRIMINDPTDQSDEAAIYAGEICDILCSEIFGDSAAPFIDYAFLGFKLRVHRHDLSGSLQPLAAQLRRDLDQPPPSEGLYKIVIRKLSSLPCLSWVQARVQAAGVRDLVNVAYEHVESSTSPRDNTRQWQHPFLVALYFSSAAGARSMRHDKPALIAHILQPFLGNPLVKMSATCHPEIPLLTQHEPIFHLDGGALPDLQRVRQTYRQLNVIEVYKAQTRGEPTTPTEDLEHSMHASNLQESTGRPSSSNRTASPKRTRNGASLATQPRALPPPSHEPDATDLRLRDDVEALVFTLYNRHPTETYQYIEHILGELEQQLNRAGHLSSTMGATQEEHGYELDTRPLQKACQDEMKEAQVNDDDI